MGDLSELKVRRSAIKGQFTRLINFVEAFSENQVNELLPRLEKFEHMWQNFDDVQTHIEYLDQDEINRNTRLEFEEKYFKYVAIFKELVSKYNSAESVSTSINSNQNTCQLLNNTTQELELQKFTLPKFSREYEKWFKFRNTFESLIINSNKFDNAQKFYRLQECVEGEAERVIEGIDDFQEAWQLLVERFEDKPGMIQKHLKEFIDLPRIKEESAELLRKFLDEMNRHVRALKSLNEPVDNWDRILILLMARKLDDNSRDAWEQARVVKYKGIPNFQHLLDFILERCKSLEAKSDSNKQKGINYAKNYYKTTRPGFRNNSFGNGNITTAHVSTQPSLKCEFCNGQHYIYFCKKLQELSVKNRKNEIKKLKLCINCLRNTHYVAECRSTGCKICKGKHNTLIHEENSSDTPVDSAESTILSHVNINCNCKGKEAIDLNSSLLNLHCKSNKSKISHVFLSTAIVSIQDKFGKSHKVRCLLDNGSQPSFVTQELVNKLKLKCESVDIPVVGVNQAQTNIKSRTQITIKSIFNNFSAKIPVFILDKITTNIPINTINVENIKIPSNLTLADPNFNISSKIDILLGASIFFDLLCAGQIKLGANMPTLQKTLLGWIIAGPFYTSEIEKLTCNFSIANESLNEIMERFWHTEEVDIKQFMSKEEAECEALFMKTITRNKSGRFVVTLPVRENFDNLGDTRTIAESRMQSVERKFVKNPRFKEKYVDFMREYIRLGHMTKIDSYPCSNERAYYLPHHGVVNEGSATTKLRVVFDGSARPSAGLALNDVLKVGPCVQDDLFAVLCRFRKHKFVIISDIEKMYRMVEIKENQRNLQQIMWRENVNEEMQHYKLNTVTYGTSPASFLATRCLKQISDEISSESPLISKIIRHDFYVDDLISGANTVDEAVFIGREIAKVLSSYGFNLRKWNSNNSAILEALIGSIPRGSENFLTKNDSSKTLGIYWKASTDQLEYLVNLPSVCSKITKRTILSTIAKIFDPLGLIGPVTIKAKIFMQKMWKLKLEWDESVPLEIFSSWKEFSNQLQILNTIKIPRLLINGNSLRIELHGFSDASEQASAACVYIKVLDIDNMVTVRLVASKSRVAPLQSISLPRLELCGAVLLSKLMRRVVQAFNEPKMTLYYWCDSTIVLSWLRREPSSLKTFVANRISQIQNLTNQSDWRHVESKQNPADIVSRGVMPAKLASERLWWNGPQFLHDTHEYKPFIETSNPGSLPELKKLKAICLNSCEVDISIIDRYSSLKKLQRVVGWIFRFFNNARKGKSDRILSNQLSLLETNESLNVLIRLVQSTAYSREINKLRQSKDISRRSKIRSLSPFLSEDNLLRVGGRLCKANIEYARKHPIILPPKNNLVRLIIKHEHLKQLHAGPLALLATIRQRFWPVHGKQEVRSVLSRCLVCFRKRPLSLYQKMGDLPASRVKPCRPFDVCGTDFAGPFQIKDGKLRNRAIIKAYICIFVCFSTKAVHIEVISDLTSRAFLNCFKRFISRRGLCSHIYSDNGKTYVGANNYIMEVHDLLLRSKNDPEIQLFLNENRISWHFIPSLSPHHGGIWEAAVKSAKYHAMRIIGKTILTFEELTTLFTQIEAILNSRPLTELSSNPADLEPLSPGHFLIGSPLNALPESDIRDVPDNRLPKYELLRKLQQHFWSRWSREYLATLNQRSKWTHNSGNIKIGTLVLLREDNVPPLFWRMGRVVSIHPGPDQLVRVVSVHTNNGVVKRSVQKVCPLPID